MANKRGSHTTYKYKRQKSKGFFVQGGEGAYRIYELEEQTLGFRKIYDWLNKLKQTTAQTEEIHF